MVVEWKNKRIKKQLENFNSLKAKYGAKVARKVVQRIREIECFPTYADLPQSSGKHSLKDGKKLRYFSVDLPSEGGGRGKWRLAFLPSGDYDPANQKTITSVIIIGIKNHHK